MPPRHGAGYLIYLYCNIIIAATAQQGREMIVFQNQIIKLNRYTLEFLWNLQRRKGIPSLSILEKFNGRFTAFYYNPCLSGQIFHAFATSLMFRYIPIVFSLSQAARIILDSSIKSSMYWEYTQNTSSSESK